jgi:hypothetical protein
MLSTALLLITTTTAASAVPELQFEDGRVPQCEAIRGTRSDLRPDGQGSRGCASLTDEATCETSYLTKKAAPGDATIALCGMVSGECIVVETFTCADEPLAVEPEETRVLCARFDDIVEDSFDPVHASFAYGRCVTALGVEYYISDEGQFDSTRPLSGSAASLSLRRAPAARQSAVELGKINGSEASESLAPSWVVNRQPLYLISSVHSSPPAPPPTQHRSLLSHNSTTPGGHGELEDATAANGATVTKRVRRELAAADIHDVLMVRLQYTNAGPAYCSEDCVENGNSLALSRLPAHPPCTNYPCPGLRPLLGYLRHHADVWRVRLHVARQLYQRRGGGSVVCRIQKRHPTDGDLLTAHSPSSPPSAFRAGMWGTSGGVSIENNQWSTSIKGNIDAAMRWTSYGITSFPRARSPGAITVAMRMPVPPQTAGCPFYEAMDIANDKARLQGIDPSLYTHVEYFLPSSFGSCPWSGLANLGCAKPGAAKRPGACFTLIKDGFPTTRMHETGHNLGFYHAGTPSNGYGDESSVMGSRRDWKGFNAPNRYSAGWLTSADVQRVTASRQYLLRPLHLAPQKGGPPSAFFFDCAKCVANEPKTQVWVSYREGTGYDEDLPPLFRVRFS